MGLTEGQRDVIWRVGRPAYVMAGAGTGKTFTLSRRIAAQAALEDHPLRPEETMAITFTEKAASELLDRVRAATERTAPAAAEHMDAAQMSTIHAMCRQILSENAFDARMDPGMVVMTEDESRQMTDALMDSTVTPESMPASSALLGIPAARDAAADFLRHGATVPGGPAAIRLYERRAHAFWSASDLASLADGIDGIASAYASAAQSSGTVCGRAVCRAAASGLRGLASDGTADAYAVGMLACRLLRVAEAYGDASCAYSLGKGLRKKADKERLASVLDRWQPIYLTAMDEVVWRAEHEIRDAASSMASERRRLMGEAGKVTFDALLSDTAELLSSSDGVRASVAGSYSSVMVDEFQDTDPLQSEIVSMICSLPGPQVGDAPPTGISKLVTVGDEQQSIYSFRGADLSVSRDMERRMSELSGGDVRVPLDTNFRSNAGILGFVDTVFSSDSLFGDEFLHLSPIDTNANDTIGGDPEVELVVSDRSNRAGNAQAAAVRMRELHDRDGVPYGDMMLLLRSLSNVDVWRHEMDALGIPNVIAGGRKFYAFRECQLAALMSSLLSGGISMPDLTTLCTSEAFAVTDADMAAMRREWDGAGEDARTAMSVLRDAARHAPTLRPVVSVVDAFSDPARLPECLVAASVASGWRARCVADGASGMARWANVERVSDILATHMYGEGMTAAEALDAVLDAVGRATAMVGASDSEQRPGRVCSDDGRADAVSVMTVHASKGLESDVVICGEAESSVSHAQQLTFVSYGTGKGRAMCASLASGRVPGKDARKALAKGIADRLPTSGSKVTQRHMRESAMEAAIADATDASTSVGRPEMCETARMLDSLRSDMEAERIVYVALTRAKRKLIWCGQCGDRRSEHRVFAKAVEAAAPDLGKAVPSSAYAGNGVVCPSANGHIIYVDGTLFSGTGTASDTGFDVVSYDAGPRLPRLSPCANVARRRRSFSRDFDGHGASELIGTPAAGHGAHARTPDGDRESSLRRGSAFHAVMSRAALRDVGEGDIRTCCMANGCPEDAPRIARMVWRVTSSDLWRGMSGNLSPEVPVRVTAGGETYDGFIDLLRVDGGHAVIYDYKTGLTSETDDEIRDTYLLQGMTYALAVLSDADSGIGDVTAQDLVVGDGTGPMRVVELGRWTSDDVGMLTETLGRALRRAEELRG